MAMNERCSNREGVACDKPDLYRTDESATDTIQ